jgi:hypothetical protein
VKNQLLLGESASQKLFNGFNVPLSVMLLREPVEPQQQLQEQALGSAPAFEWPGVDAVIESYRKFNKGNCHPFIIFSHF